MEHLDIYSETSWALSTQLEAETAEHGPDQLHDLARELAPVGARVLDVGCRDAAHLIRLVSVDDARTGLGVDPVAWHVARAREAVAEAGLAERISLVEGLVEQVELDGGFDLVWCRDVLEAVTDQAAVLSAMARLLAADGRILLYAVFATPLLAEHEQRLLEHGLGLRAERLDQSRVEGLFGLAGLDVEQQLVVGTTWREHEETRRHSASEALVQRGRLRRDRERYVEEFGQQEYDIEEASLHWLPFILLGKLCPVVYVLRTRGAAEPCT